MSRVDIRRPAKVIGTNTVGHLQSGLYYGYIGLVDGILERIVAELGGSRASSPPAAWPGRSREDSRYIAEIDDMLTLDGLLHSLRAQPHRAAARPRALRRKPC